MAKRLQSSHDGLKRIFFTVFGVAFVLLFGVMLYAASRGTDYRSRAAQEEIVYKAWEFNGSDLEGWDVSDPHTMMVSDGSLNISLLPTSTIPHIYNKTVATKLPRGNKYVSLVIGGVSDTPMPKRTPTRKPLVTPTPTPGNGFGEFQGVPTEEDVEYQLSIDQGIVCPVEVKDCGGNIVGKVSPRCDFVSCDDKPLIVELAYKLVEKETWEKPIRLKLKAGETQGTLKAKLPEIGGIAIERIRFTFVAGFSPNTKIAIDAIRLIGAKENVTTPTPTPVGCTPAKLATIDYFQSCGKNMYRRAEYRCSDGFEGKMGSPSNCKKDETWYDEAVLACNKRQICPTPTSTPTSTLSPTLPPGGGVGICPQDAKKCPDGSYVGRTGPNCAFAPCPTAP